MTLYIIFPIHMNFLKKSFIENKKNGLFYVTWGFLKKKCIFYIVQVRFIWLDFPFLSWYVIFWYFLYLFL